MVVERSSKRQKELLNFVDSFIQGHGYGPSYREIMKALGYKSVSTIAIHLNGLIAKGYVRKRDNSARSLEVITLNPEQSVVKKSTNASQEKWLVNIISDRFDDLDNKYEADVLDEMYVLIGALKILGFDGAYVAMKSRLIDYAKKHQKTPTK